MVIGIRTLTKFLATACTILIKDMETIGGIPIIGSGDKTSTIDELSLKILKNALQTMSTSLVEMEKVGNSEKQMMDKCVWPILHEAGQRFASISDGDLDVPEAGFEFVVG